MEHKFAIPNKQLNSEEFFAANGLDLFIRGEDLIVSGDCTKEEAQIALDNHNPVVTEPTLKDKLTALGLTAADLKALGL
jgi:hypothetical protein